MGRLRKIAIILGILIVLTGLVGVVYPFIGAYVNSRTHTQVVKQYDSAVESLSEKENKRLLAEADDYNKKILSRGDTITSLTEEEYKAYEKILDFSEVGMLGYINIPAIEVTLPIYHGTEEEVLQTGIGHLAGSSLPVGGETSYTVLTGHSGLPSRKLFTDLDQLEAGDRFTVIVLDRTSAYEVDSIEVVRPEELDHITFEEGRDICALVTCTPIGVNTHRLVVRAHRVEYESAEKVPVQQERSVHERPEELKWYILIGVAWLLIAVLGVYVIVKLWRRKG